MDLDNATFDDIFMFSFPVAISLLVHSLRPVAMIRYFTFNLASV